MGIKFVKPAGKVGPGKPPKHSQFKPGQSGNPKGRPKGSQNIATLVSKELNRKIAVTENGKQKKIALAEAIARRLVTDSAKGNVRSLELIIKLMAVLGQQADSAEQAGEIALPDAEALARIHKRLAKLIEQEGGADGQESQT